MTWLECALAVLKPTPPAPAAGAVKKRLYCGLLLLLLSLLLYRKDDFVEVGLISRPHGVRGEVKVQLITDEPKKRLGTAGKR